MATLLRIKLFINFAQKGIKNPVLFIKTGFFYYLERLIFLLHNLPSFFQSCVQIMTILDFVPIDQFVVLKIGFKPDFMVNQP
jgi:hypothetical protein